MAGKGTRKLGTCWGRRVRRGKVFEVVLEVIFEGW